MSKDRQLADIDADMASGFHGHIGHRLVQWEPELAVLELEIGKQHLNRGGVIHGGVLATLIDAVCGFAGCYSEDPAERRGAITLSLTVSFTGQVSGGIVRAVGRRKAGGRRIYFATGEVFGPDGELIAMGEGSFRVRSGPLPAQGGDD